MMTFIFLIIFSSLVFAEPCGLHEIYVREQWIKAYQKSDGTKVSPHTRDAHCREIERSNYFQDSTNQKFTNIKPKIRKWDTSEKSIDPTLKFEFGLAAGWNIDSAYKLIFPSKLLMPDSKDSIEEDLTNHIEIYYSDPSRLMTFNPLSFLAIKKIIESKESDK